MFSIANILIFSKILLPLRDFIKLIKDIFEFWGKTKEKKMGLLDKLTKVIGMEKKENDTTNANEKRNDSIEERVG